MTRWTHKETEINEKTDCLKYYRLNLREGHRKERNLQIFCSVAEILNKIVIARVLPRVNKLSY